MNWVRSHFGEEFSSSSELSSLPWIPATHVVSTTMALVGYSPAGRTTRYAGPFLHESLPRINFSYSFHTSLCGWLVNGLLWIKGQRSLSCLAGPLATCRISIGKSKSLHKSMVNNLTDPTAINLHHLYF